MDGEGAGGGDTEDESTVDNEDVGSVDSGEEEEESVREGSQKETAGEISRGQK